MAREGNNPKRRIVAVSKFSQAELDVLAANLVYEGSGHHKRRPADYGFTTVNPRPWKSLCDRERIVLLNEAKTLFDAGIRRGMISSYFIGGRPKYVWTVDGNGVAFEAKLGVDTYHGYALEDDDDMAAAVQKEWKKR